MLLGLDTNVGGDNRSPYRPKDGLHNGGPGEGKEGYFRRVEERAIINFLSHVVISALMS